MEEMQPGANLNPPQPESANAVNTTGASQTTASRQSDLSGGGRMSRRAYFTAIVVITAVAGVTTLTISWNHAREAAAVKTVSATAHEAAPADWPRADGAGMPSAPVKPAAPPAAAPRAALQPLTVPQQTQPSMRQPSALSEWRQHSYLGALQAPILIGALHAGNTLQVTPRALGPVMLHALEKEYDVIEVMRNHSGEVVIDRHGRGMEPGGTMSDLEAEELIGVVAALNHQVANENNPIIEAELPIGAARFTGVMLPAVPRPVISIRKPAPVVFTLDDYVAAGIMARCQAQTLRSAVADRRNILIAGPTASGKTTLANALLAEFDPAHRTVILEELSELRCSHPHTVYLYTTGTADLLRLLRTTMRLRPDRIIIGELRGAEALTLLKAWNTGHPGGLTTIHSGDPKAALIRLETLVQEANVPPQQRLISEAVDLIVSIAQTPRGRRLTGIMSIEEYDPQAGYRLRSVEDGD